MLALPGGAYVYQGEELGLAEVEDLPEEVLQDPGGSSPGEPNAAGMAAGSRSRGRARRRRLASALRTRARRRGFPNR